MPAKASHPAERCAVLLVGDTVSCPDLRHEIPIKVPDPLVYIEEPLQKTVYVGALDLPLLAGLKDVEVRSFGDLTNGASPARDALAPYRTLAQMSVRAFRRHGLTAAIVPAKFPHGVAQALADSGIALTIDEELFAARRRIKSPPEVAAIRRASRAAEGAWDAVRSTLREGVAVTSEDLQATVLQAVACHDTIPYDIVIVPHGAQSAHGHAEGTGTIAPGEPVICDLIVRDREAGVYADVTRTFCLGEPPQELAEYHELCLTALNHAIAAVKPSATGEDINAAASEIFEAAGYPTLRTRDSGATMDKGFYHSIGHGVGLEVHEAPLLAAGASVQLLKGEVLCIEPALYRPNLGGCRLEDMVLVTKNGCELISEYPYSLEP